MIFVQSISHYIIGSDKKGWLDLIENLLFLHWLDKFCRFVYLNFRLSIFLLSGISSIPAKNTNFSGSWRKIWTSFICFIILSLDLFPIVILQNAFLAPTGAQ